MNEGNVDLPRFGCIVKARREDLGLRQDQLPHGPATTTLTKIENGTGGVAPKTLRKLDQSLRWEPGSAKRTLHGGDPMPLPFADLRLPNLPRNAPNAPVIGQLNQALAGQQSTELSGRERQVLMSAYSKILKVGTDDAGLTEEETQVLTRFIEDDELRTLHERIDWLPRAEQLKVSKHVSELESDVEARHRSDAITKPPADVAALTKNGDQSADDSESRSLRSRFASGEDTGVLVDEDGEERDQGFR